MQLHQRWYGSSKKKTVKTDDADADDSLLTDDEQFWLGGLDSLNEQQAEILADASSIAVENESPPQQQPLPPHPSSTPSATTDGAATNSTNDEEIDTDLAIVEESAAELSDATKKNATSADNDSDETATSTATTASVVKVNYQNNHSNTTTTTSHDELPTTHNNHKMKHENGTFVGANIWYRYWKLASSSSSGITSSSNNTIMEHTHDAYVLSQLTTTNNNNDNNNNNSTASISTMAYDHMVQMKTRYESVNAMPDYRVRGLGWIEHRLGMILAVIPVVNNDNDGGGGGDGKDDDVSIFIVDTVGNMKCGGSSSSSGGDEIPHDWMDYHPPLTMWVRANGPEIYTGTALPHIFVTSEHNNNNNNNDRHRCAWRHVCCGGIPKESYSMQIRVYSIIIPTPLAYILIIISYCPIILHKTYHNMKYQIHLFIHIFIQSRLMMDWGGILESSHRALSINGSIETKY